MVKLKLSKIDRKKLDKHIDKIYSELDKSKQYRENFNFQRKLFKRKIKIKAAGSFLNSEGSGLYAIQSMINHSCSPNAEIKFKYNNNELSIVALQDLQPGQEVLISYLDECAIRCSRHSRQKMLR